MKKYLLLAILTILSTNGWAAPKAYTPAPGSPERQEIMDNIRLDAYGDDIMKARENKGL